MFRLLPDIAYIVEILGRYLSNLGLNYWKVVKKVKIHHLNFESKCFQRQQIKGVPCKFTKLAFLLLEHMIGVDWP